MSGNNEIVSQINAAILAHGRWKARLDDAIETRTSEFDIDFVRSCHNCDFGKWLDSEKINLKQYPNYAIVYDLHLNVHIKTAEVMELALSGNAVEAKKEVAFGGGFTVLSARLIKEMTVWRSSLDSK